MTTSSRTFIAYCGIMAMIMLQGCGGRTLPKGETGTVSGKVTYNGTAVPAGCNVIFIRDEGGMVGIGTTDSSGTYLLRMREGLKILTGVYKVAVTPPNATENMDQDQIMDLQMAGKLPDHSGMKEVPTRYRDPEGSTLVCDVQPGSNEFNIDMKDE